MTADMVGLDSSIAGGNDRTTMSEMRWQPHLIAAVQRTLLRSAKALRHVTKSLAYEPSSEPRAPQPKNGPFKK